jgi:predicted P-loop ATPase
MFIGTTNKDDILNDETGNRRWLPMVSGAVDRDKIILDREQLWAEAASIYRSSGICWQDAARLAPTEHTEFMIEDIWLPKIAAYLREYEGQKFTFDLTSSCILIGALALEVKHQNRGDEMRVGKVMRALGYKKTRLMVKGLRLYVWVK